jgi:antitoxin CptB
MMNKLEILKKRLIYRASYRGTKEMDILLSSFVKIHIDKFTQDELLDLEKFLNLEDEIIYNFYYKKVNEMSLMKNKIFQILRSHKV